MKRMIYICVLCLMVFLLPACGKAGDRVAVSPQLLDLNENDNNAENEGAPNQDRDIAAAADGEKDVAENNNIKTENNVSGQSMNVNTGADPYVGEYNDEAINNPNLEIQKKEDGSYQIQIGIYRLTRLYDCIGRETDGGLSFSTTEWGADREIRGTITLEGDVATVIFTAGWSDYSFGDVSEYKYHKTSDTPNISMPKADVNLNSYVGEYSDHDNNEPNLEIQQKNDGTYHIQIGIFRLTFLKECVGYVTDDGIEFSTTEQGADREIRGIITLEGDVATVTFTAGWSWEPSEYRYYKTFDVPNIYVP